MRLSSLTSFAVFTVLFAIVVVVPSCQAAMSCYQCNSTKDSDCQESFDHANLGKLDVHSKPCTVNAATYCIKTVGVWGGVVGTTRFCSSRDMGNQCQFISYPDHDRVYRACIYTCENDNCNGATSFSASLLATIMTSFLVLALHRW